MAEPRAFLIIENLQAALRKIEIQNGYHYDLADMAVKLDPNHEAEDLIPGDQLGVGPPRPFVVLDLSEPSIFEYATTKTHVLIRRPFHIVWVHDYDVTIDSSLIRTYERGLADVEQAITQDVHRNQLANDTRILTTEMRAPEGREVWASTRGEIRIDRPYGAPNG